ncbi:TonB-dependent receptor [Dyella sp.]|uniref:TonB-dependent receptor n=1 Tax=Dyella sp. TaxID=1869338 RepID=UPI002ED1A4DC
MILKRNVLALAIASAGLCFTVGVHAAPADGVGAGPAPQDAQSKPLTADQQKAADEAKKQGQSPELAKSLEGITVTGYNASMEKAIDYQRYADTIQNVITSADIGGLPDQSIADALTRLPGVSAERIAGQASQVNIRGLSGNFIQTTLDGREQPSTSGSNYIQFDQYPSELINMATVYKSSQASLITGGVGGTIGLQTANPLEAPKEQNLNVDARGSYTGLAHNVAGANALGYRLSAAYQGKFLDNTLGIGLGVAQLYQPHVSEQFVGEQYNSGLEPINSSPGAPQAYIPEGIQLQQNGGQERRTGYLGTVVWKPTDELQITADSFFSKFKNGSFGYGLRSQNFYNGNTQITNPVFGPNGSLIGGDVSGSGQGSQFSNETTADNYTKVSDVFSGGLNLKWNSGPWHVDGDLSMSRAQGHEVNVDATADPYTGLGTGNPQLAAQSLSYLLTGRSIGQVTINNPGMYTDLNQMALSRYGVYPYVYHDRNKAFRASVKYDLPNNSLLSALEVGVYANNHTYNADRTAYVYGSEWNSNPALGQPPLTIDSGDATVRCWKGTFGSFPCFLQLNGPGILASHGITGTPVKDIINNNWTYVQSGQVDQKVRDLFLMADIETQLFGHELNGNVGVRVSHDSQYSTGLQQVGNGAGIPITDGNGATSSDFAPLHIGKKYTDYLPSLNLIYHLTDNDQVRFSAAKVLARPPINSMLAGSGSYITDGNTYNIYGGTSPLLDPLRAQQYDATYEHYFDDSSGAFTAGVFFKHIKSFVQQVTYHNFDFASVGITVPIDPNTGAPYIQGDYQTAYNAKGGDVRGVEMSFTKTHFLPGMWAGLGVDANLAVTSSSVKNPSALGGPTQMIGLPGLSQRVASAAVFYDNGPFSARVSANYRSHFVSDTQIAVDNQLVVFASELVYDFQASYSINDKLKVVYQLLNASNQPTRTYFTNQQQTGTIQYFGRTNYLGVEFKL